MEHPIIEIKNAVIQKIKSLEPETDVFFEKIKETDQELEKSRTWYFLSLIPGQQGTVDGIFTDVSVLVDIAYHEKSERNTDYLMKGAELDAVMRPVLRFGDRAITIHNADIKVVDHVLHYSFSLQFRTANVKEQEYDRMGELEVGLKKEDSR